GVRSPEAQALKEKLYDLGYLDIAKPNDHFGPKTETAVQAFQRDHGLNVNGIAGTETLLKLKEALEVEMNESIPSPFTSVLRQGDSSDSVIMLKQYLEAAGYSTNTSSTYDQLTAEQVKAYQSANGLSATGSANGQTLSSLVEKRGTKYVFSGKERFGHGVGMTQWGAYGMAQQGYSYDEILKHYYTGIDVVSSDSYKNKTMRVLLGDTKKNTADIETSSAYSIVTTSGDTLFEDIYGSTTVTYGSGGNGTYTATNNGTKKTTKDPIYATSANNGTIEYDDVTYKGEIHFSKSLVDGKYTSSWVMDVVNHVSIDTYLEGVVPYEMYTSWNEPDAYKAQAVAARSYAITKMKTTGTFDVYNDTRSQVYHGVPTGAHSNPTILNAIQATSGQAIHYNSQLVEGVYSASASGHTVDAADVWGNNIGYLIGVPDPYDPSQYNQVSWTDSFSLKELSAVDYFRNENKGEVLALQPTMKNERLQSIDVIMEKGTITLTGDQFRSAVDSSAMKSNILSIEEIN
ncbi:SpoIID/LytB domain-containing protein, partial [Marinococcus luteus]|uniref:SpoIID/LytB domain-containing protein n=1 Tax=Marinococcus luteus TaxID=1122204 RepID=UPI002ACC4EE0